MNRCPFNGEGGHTVIPHATITLNAVSISQWTHTGVGAQTLPAVAHPGFTEVTYCPLAERKGIELKTWTTENQPSTKKLFSIFIFMP